MLSHRHATLRPCVWATMILAFAMAPTLYSADPCFISQGCVGKPGDTVLTFQPRDNQGNPVGPPLEVPVKCDTVNRRSLNINVENKQSGFKMGDHECGAWVAKQTMGLLNQVTVGDKIGECGPPEPGIPCRSAPPNVEP